MIPARSSWYAITNAAEIPSPALLVYPKRIEENIRRMISIAGGVARLRPHMKTHKLPEVIQMQMAAGITQFKCATIAEAEMVAACSAPDLLLAYQPVGPNIDRLVELTRRFPRTRVATVADDIGIIHALSKAFAQANGKITVLLDIDCGMHRTGMLPDEHAREAYALLSTLPALKAGGLHAYDGHIHDFELKARQVRCDESFAPVAELQKCLLQAGYEVPRMVLGGTPTFPIHARRADAECSPGTCLLWDVGYRTKLPDLDFLSAAVVLTRVVSKPGVHRLCLDLGHKALASENPHPRVELLELPDAKAITHSEEHLVVETARAAEFAVGGELYGIPWHICPTVALHSNAIVVEKGRADTRWKVVARERMLTL